MSFSIHLSTWSRSDDRHYKSFLPLVAGLIFAASSPWLASGFWPLLLLLVLAFASPPLSSVHKQPSTQTHLHLILSLVSKLFLLKLLTRLKLISPPQRSKRLAGLISYSDWNPARQPLDFTRLDSTQLKTIKLEPTRGPEGIVNKNNFYNSLATLFSLKIKSAPLDSWPLSGVSLLDAMTPTLLDTHVTL